MSPAPKYPKRPHPNPPKPKLRLHIDDLEHDGCAEFCKHVEISKLLQEAYQTVIRLLYTDKCHIPPSRSVTLTLKPMDGVAYTTGLELDGDHKEIYLSADYIMFTDPTRRKEEIKGVTVHEMVHCWQYNGQGTAPGGLIEGIADWVRLHAGLAPPHWKKESGGDWDAGYQHTGYFLDYLEKRFGEGTVIQINQRLRDRKYDEDSFWIEQFGEKVGSLWEQYGRTIKEENGEKTAEKVAKSFES